MAKLSDELREAERKLSKWADWPDICELLRRAANELDRRRKRKRAAEYVIWSNEHKCWWAAEERGYNSCLAYAGRYDREQALKICTRARGGRQFNSNPSEVPILVSDAERFWPDDKPEWAEARMRHEELYSN